MGQRRRVTDPGLPTVVLQVYSRAVLDSLLQGKWTAMKDALRQGRIDRALGSIALAAREGYRELFTALTVPLS